MSPAEHSQIAVAAAVEVVAAEYGVPAAHVLDPACVPLDASPSRRELRGQRHLACYLATVGIGVPLSRTARVCAVDRMSIHRGLRRLEERRDDPAFDARLERLERRAVQAFQAKTRAA